MKGSSPRLNRARDYVLAHPDESKSEQARGANVSEETVALARRSLIGEGKLQPSRKTGAAKGPSPPPAAPPPQVATMLDHAAMSAIADIADIDAEDLDDDTVIRRVLKQCLKFAFDPKLHPDTRMSASQMWAKLRDQTRAKSLGPGVPTTRPVAVTRLSDLDAAVGPSIAAEAAARAYAGSVDFLVSLLAHFSAQQVMSAIEQVFTVREDASAPSEGVEAEVAVGTQEAPGPA